MLMEHTIFIAEAGVNHNGDIDLAHALIDAAADAGADIVKFQTFNPTALVSKKTKLASYQTKNMSTYVDQLSMLSTLTLTQQQHCELIKHCKDVGIEFLSTAFDHDSLNFLISLNELKRLKIPSGEITNGPLILEHATTGLEIILSTGMATVSEIEHALAIIAYGYLGGGATFPSSQKFWHAYFSEQGQSLLKQKVTLLHCTTEYPAPYQEVNLNVIRTLRTTFGLPVGYSDHTFGREISLAACAMGSTIIEKHFTMSRDLNGPDHASSLEPADLKQLIIEARHIKSAMGSSQKLPTQSELKNIEPTRKSIVAAVDISEGEIFTENNLMCIRPGGGVSPMRFWDLLGAKAERKFSAGSQVY